MAKAQSGDTRAPLPPDRRDPWESRAVPGALCLLGALLLQGLAFIGESSQTSDEAAHLAAGYSYLKTADFRLNPEHPPLIKELAALPLLALDLAFPWGPLWDRAEEWNVGRLFVHENHLPNDTILWLGRLPILALSLLLGWILFLWGRRLFGARGALLALALYVLDPNVVAHSCLVTTDLGVTLFMFLTVFALRSWAARPAPRRLLLVGLMAGGCFASKFTAFWILPILAVLGVALLALKTEIPARPWSPASRFAPGGRFGWRRFAALAVAGLLVMGIAFLVVVSSYCGWGLPAYFEGLRRGLMHSDFGHTAFLMGRYSDTGWWYYFLAAYLFKTPPGTLLIVGASIVSLVRRRRWAHGDEVFLWVPILITLGITCSWKVNIGLRHLLPVYPFLYLSCGRIVSPLASDAPRAVPGRWRRALPAAVMLCLAWNAVEALRIAPYELAYFNAFVGGPQNGHRLLLDSNLDWGQSSKALRRFVTSENLPVIYCAYSGNSDPWYYGVRYQYAPGSGNLENSKNRPVRMPDVLPREVLAVSAMVLHSVHFSDQNLYAWLRERRPVAQPGYSYFVYDITDDLETQSYLAVLYVNFGLPDLAEFQARRTLRRDPGNTLAQAVLERIREPGPGSSPRAAPEPREDPP
jgi:dolichyl-phosphate-mannose-protein mannosyltransferase